MVEAAGADIVDINFGCPVRKVTKTGAGASLLDDPAHAARIVEAVAGASTLPVSVKMRRGTANGSRDCLVVGPRLVEAGAASLTLHPRSAKQMYTGVADHSLTAELVVARRRAGDRLGRRHLARAGAGRARDDRRRGGDGRPRRAGEPVGARARSWATRHEPVARGGRRRAAALHPRDGARARRVPRDRLPEEVLRLVPRAAAASRSRSSRSSSMLDDDRGGRAAAARRGARARPSMLERLEAELPDPVDEVLLDSLPISIYGGG